MDCYYHNAVPSIATCADCARTICGTCRDAEGLCPSCRLEARIRAAAAERGELPGGVGRSNPPPNPGPASAPRRQATAVAAASTETRALVGFGYPLWPLAALALLDPKKSPYIRRQATQAIAFNFGCYGLSLALALVAHIPLLGFSALPLLALIVPVWFVASVVYGIKAWHGDDVRVPLISDWLDEREGEPQSA